MSGKLHSKNSSPGELKLTEEVKILRCNVNACNKIPEMKTKKKKICLCDINCFPI